MHRVEVIQTLIDYYNYKTYLEIGVRYFKTYNKIKIDHKESIDHDPAYKVTYLGKSDEVFKELDSNKKYDIIFIDGDHSKEQVFKDVINSLLHLNKNGSIVCHDMCPPSSAYLAKNRCDDGWEAFAKLRQTREDLEMFVVNTDYGCGVIRIGKQSPYEGKVESGYNFFKENKEEVLNLINIEEYKKNMENRINILITSSGGPAAIGLIKSIRALSNKIRIIATDCDKLASGLYLADKYYIVPKDNVKYKFQPSGFELHRDAYSDILSKEKINIILPTSESDIYHWSLWSKELYSKGIHLYISDPTTIQKCQDKLRFYQICKENSLPIPDLYDDIYYKPIIGSGGRGTGIIKNKDNLYMEYLPGEEYTVDVFCDLKENICGLVIRERIGVKAGISVKGRIIKDKEIESICKKVCDIFKIKGPCCIQLKRDKNGDPKLIECNPRLGGGTYFSTLAGINPAEIYFNLYYGNLIKKKIPKEITIVRYFEEIIV